jgi:hypothetical protein
LPAEQLAAYLSELCARPLVTVFGTLIYDEGSVSLRKLLRDTDYWDALNIASGPHFEVFAIRDTEGYAKDDGGQLMELMTAASMSRSRSRGHYFSTLLKTYFHEPKTRLAYPSMLIFFVEQRRVMHCWLIPLPQAPLVETFEHLKTLFSQVADGIQEAGGPAVSSDTLRNHLRQKLLEADYTLYRQAPPSDAEEAVHKLVSFVER